MSSFTKSLPEYVEAPGSANGFLVKEPFNYYSHMFGSIINIHIHAGFYTDLMSGPDKLKEAKGINRATCAAASIIHDRLYDCPYVLQQQLNRTAKIRLNRKQCDQLYQEAMHVLKHLYPEITDEVIHDIYKLLRNWGWYAWYRHCIRRFFKGLPV